MKPSALPASSTGQWRACCGSSGRDDSRRGGEPDAGAPQVRKGADFHPLYFTGPGLDFGTAED